MPIDAEPLYTTDYQVSPQVLDWAQGEVDDFLYPQNWELSKEKDGKSMWRKRFPKEVTAYESTSTRNAAYWKFSAVIPGADVDDLYDLMHRQCTQYQPYLSEGFQSGELLEVVPPERAGYWPDEAAVQYKAFKVPMVGPRDFLTLTMQKNFAMPDGRQVIGLLTKSIDDYPSEVSIKGDYVRGEVLSCCVFLVPTPEGCSYTLTQRANVHLSFPLPPGIVHKGEKSHIWRHFDVIRQVVRMHQANKRRGQYTAAAAYDTAADPVALAPPSLPPMSAYGFQADSYDGAGEPQSGEAYDYGDNADPYGAHAEYANNESYGAYGYTSDTAQYQYGAGGEAAAPAENTPAAQEYGEGGDSYGSNVNPYGNYQYSAAGTNTTAEYGYYGAEASQPAQGTYY
eukprot:RCo023197